MCACRRICCTGVMPGQIRLSASTWRQERTGRWCWPTTTWTCSLYLCLRATSTGVTGQIQPPPLFLGNLWVQCCRFRTCLVIVVYLVWNRTHANGSIKRGSKDNATDSVSLRTGIGVQLKDIKVFNRARQQGKFLEYLKCVAVQGTCISM